MSWTLASFAVLALALLAGFAWYERSHPSAKVLALVATLAALAALGRIAFAPLPNVKPISDIVLISGFALGGAPGFAVGALSALTSNVFYGQGPWTPWQMAGWGAIGVGGALLARLTRGRVPRVPLALACAVAGLFFGTVMNVFTWLTFSDPDATGGLLVIAGRALPFDIAHAVGNLVFFLAFGPALIAAIARFRARFEISWVPSPEPRSVGDEAGGRGPAAGAAAAAIIAALVIAAGALAGPATASGATGAQFLRGAQNADGGWGGDRGQSSTQLYTGWAALGMAAAGNNPLDVRRGGRSAVDFIRRGIAGLTDTGELERTIMVLASAGVSPRSIAGHDLVAELARRRRRDGSFGGQVAYTAFGIFALRAAGFGTSSAAVRAAGAFLARQQNPDGGFNFFGRGGGSGVDDTGAALQGLVAAGRHGRPVTRAASWLRRRQSATGGFPLQPGGTPNAQSTAWAVQGLVAAGVNPAGVRRRGGRNPLAFLRSLTAADGSVAYSRTGRQTPVWVTGQALTALARKPFPLARVPRLGRAGGAASAAALAAGTAALTGVRPASPGHAEKGRAVAGPRPTALTRALVLARGAGFAMGLLFTPFSGPKR